MPRCSNMLPPSIWLLLSLLLLLLLLPQSTLAILPTAQVSVWLPSSSSSNEPTYELLASQASFGDSPEMGIASNPLLVLRQPPESINDPLLCNNDKEEEEDVLESAFASLADHTVLLVPRGACTFERKAWNAQKLGAKAIIIYGTLSSRYSMNETTQTAIYPQQYNDYDCHMGRAEIAASEIQPPTTIYPAYNPQNDAILSGNTTHNLCLKGDTDQLSNCPSKACLLTGPPNATTSTYQACCAWDLHVWLYNDVDFENKTLHNDPKQKVTIPALYVTMHQGQQLLQDLKYYSNTSRQQSIRVVLSMRWRSSYNISAILIWMLGVAVAAAAAFLSASDYHKYLRKALRRQQQQLERQESSSSMSGRRRRTPSPRRRPPQPEESMELTVHHALVFIVMASTSLLVLFYFKIYNVVKILYALGCSKAVSQVIVEPVFKKVMRQCRWRNIIVWRTGTEDFGDITVRTIAAHMVGYAFGLAWLVLALTVRHADRVPFFWIMQNIFGACLCIMFLQVIKLNSIEVASTLLLVAFFYDIFFVFVTPLIFKGKSVMITVATSGGPPKADPSWCEKYPNDADCQGGDPLPMLFSVPRVNDYQGGSSLLGLGDIVLPGLLLSFAARFDAAKSLLGVLGGNRNGSLNTNNCPERRYCWNCLFCSRGYVLPLVVAYAVGLFMANAAVYVMNMGQPALLYLVPCCLGTITFMGWRRKELKDLWHGPKAIRAADDVLYGEYGSGSNSPPASPSAHQRLPTQDGGMAEDAIPEPPTSAESNDDEEEGDHLPLLEEHNTNSSSR